MKTVAFSVRVGIWPCFTHGHSKWLLNIIVSGVRDRSYFPKCDIHSLASVPEFPPLKYAKHAYNRGTRYTKNKSKLHLYLIFLSLAIFKLYEHLLLYSNNRLLGTIMFHTQL